MIKNVFIKSGELNHTGGTVATVSDLNFSICKGENPLRGLLQLDNGIYMWQSSENLKKILEKDIGIEITEENDFEGEYIKICDNKKVSLKDELEADLKEGFEKIISCCVDSLDICLRAITKCHYNDTVYVYNYNRNENGAVEKTSVICCKEMLQGLFQAS